ncbi:UNVERIFIED_CONTAM: hypothetical protein Sradi_6837600 [Sesamum radiatum]|uniref:Uncharacterized protein n=1 Tax=Sesamum radiatum TaxID=300843 RepID=A0AAW2JLL9_SESRA
MAALSDLKRRWTLKFGDGTTTTPVMGLKPVASPPDSVPAARARTAASGSKSDRGRYPACSAAAAHLFCRC